MAEIQIPVDLGFTEFVTSLLSEVLRSVVAAQGEQEERHRELVDAASLTLEEFEERHVTARDVEEWLALVFPASDPARPHDAARGTPYVAATRDRPEAPPYTELLGVELTEKMVSEDTGKLLAPGERTLREAARRSLAERQLQVARDLAQRGIPRVLVESGRVTAKLTFEAVQYRDEAAVAEAQQERDDAPADEPVSSLLAKRQLRPTVMAGRLTQLQHGTVVPQALRDVRLRVHTADERAPGTATSRANVFGEVELTFKTVT